LYKAPYFLIIGNRGKHINVLCAVRICLEPLGIGILQLPGLLAGPIIALTAYSLVTDCQKCLDAGCDDYLPKPFQHHDLLNMAARHITAEKAAQLVYSPLAADLDYGELLDLFVQKMPERIDTPDAQAKSRNWNQLAETAHERTGAAGCYGLGETPPCAARLETLAREAQQEQQILSTLDELRSDCHRIRSGKPQADEAPVNAFHFPR
jgi:HPt (histidine-containing phosphotransfer) domain-containing protein